jgi:hypothetical protein
VDHRQDWERWDTRQRARSKARWDRVTPRQVEKWTRAVATAVSVIVIVAAHGLSVWGLVLLLIAVGVVIGVGRRIARRWAGP